MPDKVVATSPRIQELTRQLKQAPRPRTVLELAKAYQEAGDLGEAARVCREGLEKQPGHHSARVLLGKILLKQEEFGGAADELERVVSEVPDNLMARRLLGQAQEGAGRIQPALATYQDLLALLPGDAEVEGRVAALQSAAAAPDPAPPVAAAAAPPPAPAAPLPPMPARAGFETLDLVQDEPEVAEEAAAEPVPAPILEEEAGPVPATTATDAPELEIPPEAGTIPPTSAMPAPDVDEVPAGEAAVESAPAEEEEARREGGEAGEAPPVPRTVAMDPSELGLGEIDDDQPTQAIEAMEMKPPAEGTPGREPVVEPPAPAGDEPAGAPGQPEEAGTVMMQAPDFGGEPEPVPVQAHEASPATEAAPSADDPAGREERRESEEDGGALPTPTLAELYVEQGMPGKAVEVYERLLQGDPGNAELRQRLAALKGEEAPAPAPARRKIQVLEGWLQRIQRSRDAQGRA